MEAARTMPEKPRLNPSAPQTSFPGHLDWMDAHASIDQHVHKVPASDMMATVPGKGSEGRPSQASRQRLDTSALQASSTRMAEHEPDQLPDVGSSVPGVAAALQSLVPLVMPSLQTHREVLSAR